MRRGEIKSVHFSKKKMSFGETSSCFILQSLGLCLPKNEPVYQNFECGYFSPILNLSSKSMSNNKQMSDIK